MPIDRLSGRLLAVTTRPDSLRRPPYFPTPREFIAPREIRASRTDTWRHRREQVPMRRSEMSLMPYWLCFLWWWTCFLTSCLAWWVFAVAVLAAHAAPATGDTVPVRSNQASGYRGDTVHLRVRRTPIEEVLPKLDWGLRITPRVIPYATAYLGCTARQGKPVELRRWSATVKGAPTRRHHEPGYLEGQKSSHRRDTRTGARCDPAWLRSFPGRGPGSENRAHRPPHSDGCFRHWPGDVVGCRNHDHLSRGPRAPLQCSRRSRSSLPHNRPPRGWPASRPPMAASADPSRPPSTRFWRWPLLTLTSRGPMRRLSYLEANANSYITVESADGPGQLANLILDAHAMGVDPTNFGGTNLVARLLATEQTSGPDAGLFGTEAAVGRRITSAPTSRASCSPRSRRPGRPPMPRRSVG